MDTLYFCVDYILEPSPPTYSIAYVRKNIKKFYLIIKKQGNKLAFYNPKTCKLMFDTVMKQNDSYSGYTYSNYKYKYSNNKVKFEYNIDDDETHEVLRNQGKLNKYNVKYDSIGDVLGKILNNHIGYDEPFDEDIVKYLNF